MKISILFLSFILSLSSFSAFAETVNINKANAAALQHYLPGIGKAKSKNIIQYRKEHKKFKNITELKEVKGIGDKIFSKIKSSLSLTKGVVSAPEKTIKKSNTQKASNKKKVKSKQTKTK